MLSSEYLSELRRETEAWWKTAIVQPDLYGFQFQPGTRWNRGLAPDELGEFQHAVGFRFSADLSTFLREMNGTDLPTVNIGSGVRKTLGVGVYAYPRDLNHVRDLMGDVHRNRDGIVEQLQSEGFHLSSQANLLPIYGHRFVVCDPEHTNSTVLSIVCNDVDAVVYADSLRAYLIRSSGDSCCNALC